MHYIIVDVKIPGKGITELKIPSFITAQTLLALLSKALRLQTDAMTLRADPPGRALEPNEYLDEAGVWDGALITLVRTVS